VDAGEFRFRRGGRPHFNSPDVVRALHEASGVATRAAGGASRDAAEAYAAFSERVSRRDPITVLDLLRIKPGAPIPVDHVEPEEYLLWRFMVPGMSEGALSEPAHRTWPVA